MSQITLTTSRKRLQDLEHVTQLGEENGVSKTRSVLAVVVLVLGFLCAGTTAASAAPSCSGYGCDGQWPDQTGCAATASTPRGVTIYDGIISIGRIELRYSSSCRTVWARIISWQHGGVGEFAQIFRNSDGAQWSCSSYVWSSALNGNSCYTRMLYDGGVTSYAYGASPNQSGRLFFGKTQSY